MFFFIFFFTYYGFPNKISAWITAWTLTWRILNLPKWILLILAQNLAAEVTDRHIFITFNVFHCIAILQLLHVPSHTIHNRNALTKKWHWYFYFATVTEMPPASSRCCWLGGQWLWCDYLPPPPRILLWLTERAASLVPGGAGRGSIFIIANNYEETH